MKNLVIEIKKFWIKLIKKVRPRFKKACRRIRTIVVKKVKYLAKVFNNILDDLIKTISCIIKYALILGLVNYTTGLLEISSPIDAEIIWWIILILSVKNSDLSKLRKVFAKKKG